MTSVDFPDSPAIGDIFTVDGITRKWDGTVWSIIPVTISGPAGSPGSSGVLGAESPLEYDPYLKSVSIDQSLLVLQKSQITSLNDDLNSKGNLSDPLSQFAATSSSQLKSIISDETGTGNLVFSNSPTLVTPALGTPSSVNLTNGTNLPISTGVSGLATGISTFLSTPSSANLATAITDETGSGNLVFSNSPSLTTPMLGVASATSINKVAITAPATGATLTLANNSTLATSGSFSATLTVTGTTNVTLPTSGTLSTLAGSESLTNKKLGSLTSNGLVKTTSGDGTLSTVVLASGIENFLATGTSLSIKDAISDETGSGSLVFGTSPTITPADGVNATSATTAGFLGMPQVLNPASPYTISATDAGKHIYMTTTGRTITIPANSVTPLQIGTTIVIINAAAVTTTISINTDTLIFAGSGVGGTRTLSPNGMATVIKLTSTSWIISGNGLT